jgi:hypothetical protein
MMKLLVRPRCCFQLAGIAVATLMIMFGLSAVAAPPEALPVSGSAYGATLVGVDAAWQIEFDAGGKPQKLSAADLVLWGSFADATRGPQILLVGGGLLVADVIGLDKETLRCDGDAIGQSKGPLESVAGILWHPPAERNRRDQLAARVRGATGDADQLILDNGDEVKGTFAGMHDDVLTVETPAGPLDVSMSRLAVLIFNPSLAARSQLKGLRAYVGLSDGSRLLATRLTLKEDHAQLQAAGLGEVTVRGDKLVALQPLGGRTVYLSDLKAASYKFIPFLRLNWPYHTDANVAGNPLRCGGKLFLKGLGVHSASRLTYDLDQPYRTLQAELGIDDQTAGRGSVEFRVFVDSGNGQWQARYASSIQRGGQAPAAMSADVTGAKRISLLVEFADHGDELDYADWLNARLIK